MLSDEQMQKAERLLEQRASALDDELRQRVNAVNQEAENRGMYNSGPRVGMLHRAYKEHLKKLAKVCEESVLEFLESQGVDLTQGLVDNQLSVLTQRVLDRKYSAYSEVLTKAARSLGIQPRDVPLYDTVEAEIKRIKTDLGLKMGKDAQAAAKAAKAAPAPSYSVQGPNARINIGSVDNSTNTVTTVDVVADLKAKLQQGNISPELLASLVAALDEISAARGTAAFDNTFTKFLGLAANVMTIVQPFIPGLLQLR